jgi:hypothetical protein
MGMNALVFNVLKETGINPERFSLQWASAAEAPRFVKLITQFTGKIKELGPLGESEGLAPEELRERLEKGMAAVSSKKVRMVYGNTAKAIRKEGIFTQEYINGVIEEKLSKAIAGALSAEAEPKTEPEKKSPAAKPATAAQKAPKQKKAEKAGKKTEPAAKKKTAAPKKASAPKKKTAAKKTTAKKKK